MGKTSLAVRAASVWSRDQFDPVIFVSIKDRALEDEGPGPVKVRFVSDYLGILDEIARALGRDGASPQHAGGSRTPHPRCPDRHPRPADLGQPRIPSVRGTASALLSSSGDLPGVCKAILTALPPHRPGHQSHRTRQARRSRRPGDPRRHRRAQQAARPRQCGRPPQPLAGHRWHPAAARRWTAGQLGRGSSRSIPAAIAFLRSCPESNDPWSSSLATS